MATLTERLEADYKTALRAGERIRVDTLRLIKAAIQRTAIDKRKDALDDQEIIQVLAQQAKQRKETIESAKQGGREDILAQSAEELAILNSYLPQPLSAETVSRLVEEAIGAVGTQQGQIMKYVMTKAAGRVDGKTVSQVVTERLKRASS